MRVFIVTAAMIALVGSVRAERSVVGDAQIRAAVDEAVRNVAAPGTSVEVRAIPRLVSDDAEGVAVVDVLLPEGALAAGVRAIPVSCRVGSRVVSQGLATIAVRRDVSVWVTSRPVAAGAMLGTEDVLRESRPFDREPSREILSELEPGRWTARRALEAGAVLRSTDVARRPDVPAGAQIALVARAGSTSVSVAALARRAGDVGEKILVVNPLTGDVVEAVLVDAHTAELVAPRRGSRDSSRGEKP